MYKHPRRQADPNWVKNSPKNVEAESADPYKEKVCIFWTVAPIWELQKSKFIKIQSPVDLNHLQVSKSNPRGRRIQFQYQLTQNPQNGQGVGRLG